MRFIFLHHRGYIMCSFLLVVTMKTGTSCIVSTFFSPWNKIININIININMMHIHRLLVDGIVVHWLLAWRVLRWVVIGQLRTITGWPVYQPFVREIKMEGSVRRNIALKLKEPAAASSTSPVPPSPPRSSSSSTQGDIKNLPVQATLCV